MGNEGPWPLVLWRGRRCQESGEAIRKILLAEHWRLSALHARGLKREWKTGPEGRDGGNEGSQRRTLKTAGALGTSLSACRGQVEGRALFSCVFVLSQTC